MYMADTGHLSSKSDSFSCHVSAEHFTSVPEEKHVHSSIHPSLLLQSWQQATEGSLSPNRQAGAGGGPDWQPQRWKEQRVCLELPDALLNRSLHGDGKSWVHMQLFVGRKEKKKGKMLILLLRLVYKLLRLEAGLKASGFMACHYFLGLVWFDACICLWVVFLCSHPAL